MTDTDSCMDMSDTMSETTNFSKYSTNPTIKNLQMLEKTIAFKRMLQSTFPSKHLTQQIASLQIIINDMKKSLGEEELCNFQNESDICINDYACFDDYENICSDCDGSSCNINKLQMKTEWNLLRYVTIPVNIMCGSSPETVCEWIYSAYKKFINNNICKKHISTLIEFVQYDMNEMSEVGDENDEVGEVGENCDENDNNVVKAKAIHVEYDEPNTQQITMEISNKEQEKTYDNNDNNDNIVDDIIDTMDEDEFDEIDEEDSSNEDEFDDEEDESSNEDEDEEDDETNGGMLVIDPTKIILMMASMDKMIEASNDDDSDSDYVESEHDDDEDESSNTEHSNSQPKLIGKSIQSTYNTRLRKKEMKNKIIPDDNDDVIEIEKQPKLKKRKYNEYVCSIEKPAPKRGILKNCKTDAQRKQEKETAQRKKNTSKYKKMLEDKPHLNDSKYFKELEISAQKRILQTMEIIKQNDVIDKPYRILVLESDIPIKEKGIVMRKLNQLLSMPPGFGEYNKLKHWIDGFMNIPFGKYNNITMTMEHGVDACTSFMLEAKSILDRTVYGLNDAKIQILQYIAQMISNPKSLGTAIAIKGPMGTGKTTLVKEGISKILQRPFAFMALGGATDSSFLEGHSYTYEGSMWGKIVDILMKAGSMSPLIYFDELDKVSSSTKGEEIIGILTHLTDTTQNTKFHDRYFSDIEFDLSRALFIFSYNEEHKVNPILKDRMYCIETTGYTTKDKLIIARDYLIPAIMKNIGFNRFLHKVVFDDDVLSHIIENFTQKERGVRNLKRCLEIIFSKLNMYRIMTPGTKLFDNKSFTFEVKFPFTVTMDIVQKLLTQITKKDMSYMSLYT